MEPLANEEVATAFQVIRLIPKCLAVTHPTVSPAEKHWLPHSLQAPAATAFLFLQYSSHRALLSVFVAKTQCLGKCLRANSD